MLQFENIKNFIRENNAPYWKLFLMKQFSQKTLIYSYKCENCTDEQNKIEVSIEMLKNILQNYENSQGLIFGIELRKSNTANQDSMFGPFEFVLRNENQNLNGLGALPSVGVGYVPTSELERRLEVERQISELRLEKALFDRERNYFNESKKDIEKELTDKYKKYDTNSEVVKEGINRALGAIFSMVTGANTAPQLQGTPETSTESDVKTQAVENIASTVFENLAVEEITELEKVINAFIKRKKNVE